MENAVSDTAFITRWRRVGKSFRFSLTDRIEFKNMSEELNAYFYNNTPVNVAAEKGALVGVRILDGDCWIRAKVLNVMGRKAKVIDVDFGECQLCSIMDIAALPENLASLPPLRKDYNLAYVTLLKGSDGFEAVTALEASADQKILEMNLLYSVEGKNYVQLIVDIHGERTDVGKALIEDGFAATGKNDQQEHNELVASYTEAEQKARQDNIEFKKIDGKGNRKNDPLWLARLKLKNRMAKNKPTSSWEIVPPSAVVNMPSV